MFSRSGALHSLGLQVLAVTAVLMIAALILMSVTLSNLKDSRKQTEFTTDIFLEITTIESRLMDYDGLLNGYVLTNDAWYLKRLNEDRDQMQRAMQKLSLALHDDPVQMGLYKKAAALIQQRQMLTAFLLKPENRSAIADVKQAQSARVQTDVIRDTLWHILKKARHGRRVAQAAMVEQAQQSFWIAVGVVVLTFVFGAFCLMVSAPPKKQ